MSIVSPGRRLMKSCRNASPTCNPGSPFSAKRKSGYAPSPAAMNWLSDHRRRVGATTEIDKPNGFQLYQIDEFIADRDAAMPAIILRQIDS
jgi:hypothetical protein